MRKTNCEFYLKILYTELKMFMRKKALKTIILKILSVVIKMKKIVLKKDICIFF